MHLIDINKIYYLVETHAKILEVTVQNDSKNKEKIPELKLPLI